MLGQLGRNVFEAFKTRAGGHSNLLLLYLPLVCYSSAMVSSSFVPASTDKDGDASLSVLVAANASLSQSVAALTEQVAALSLTGMSYVVMIEILPCLNIFP